MQPIMRWAVIGFLAVVITTITGSWLGHVSLDGQQASETLRTDITTAGSPIATAAAEAELLQGYLKNKFSDADFALGGNKLRVTINGLQADELPATQNALKDAVKQFADLLQSRLDVERERIAADFQAAPANGQIYADLRSFRSWDWLVANNLAPRLEMDKFVNWDSSARSGMRTGAMAGFGLGLVISVILAISFSRRQSSRETA